jgi:fatty-acyl-CoA synthase
MEISSWIAHRALWSPEKTALRFEGREITYAQLEAQVAHLAGGMASELSVHQGDRIAYLGQSSPELLALLFACARVGAILVPLNARMTMEQLRVILSNCQPRCIFVEAPFRQQAEGCLEGMADVQLILFAGTSSGELDSLELETLVGNAEAVQWNKELPLDTAVLIAYTSGTTGIPKGAVLTQEALFYSALNSTLAYDMTSNDEILTIFPMFHVGGMTVQTTPAIHAGATVTILRQFDPGHALKEIERQGITLMVASPAMARAFSSHPNWNNSDISSLRCVGLGAAIVTSEVIRPWAERAVPTAGIYGLTEALPPAIAVPINEAQRKVGSIGVAPLYYQARVVGMDMQDLETGERGEIVLKGPGIFKEYWANPKASQEAFSDGWFHTGDVGHIDEEGYFYIDDRMKDIVIVGASNVYPADLERILDECEAIAEVAVIGRPDAKTGEALVACVVVKEGYSLTAEQVKGLLEGRLASYQHPQDVVFMDSLPHTAVGKVQKPKLRQMVMNTLNTSHLRSQNLVTSRDMVQI